MKIAIVGSGISGLACARWLCERHQVVVFEADSRIGGHANTVAVDLEDERHAIDTGFIVYNRRTYPNFTRMLEELGVATAPTSMSFSVRCDRSGTEYASHSLDGVFAQRMNALRPSFLSMLRDIVRFNRQGAADVASVDEKLTVGQYLRDNGYSHRFAQEYLLPMGAAIWSCPPSTFSRFPIRFILQFYANHGLLSLRDRPVWRVICGGSKQYIETLARPFARSVRTSCPVRSVRRLEGEVIVRHPGGAESFDEIVFACHSDQALRMLEDADPLETELLAAFPYSENRAVLHTDETLLPRRRRAWACWNYHVPHGEAQRPRVTYNMNMLQHIRSQRTFCVTLNADDSIAPDSVLARFTYHHPIFTPERAVAQRRHEQVIRRRRTSYCGAYWRNGFHEDGVVSAMAVCRRFGVDDWSLTNGSTANGSAQESIADAVDTAGPRRELVAGGVQ